MSFPLRSAFVLATLVSLAGCGSSSPNQFPPFCPSLALMDGAADITRFQGAGRDITDTVLDGRITAVPAQCARGDKGAVKTTLQVKAKLTRGAAATSPQVSVGYVVTVMQGEKILDQKDYTLATAFPPNVDSLEISGEPIELNFPPAADKNAPAYTVYVGFRLSADELAFNSKRGPR